MNNKDKKYKCFDCGGRVVFNEEKHWFCEKCDLPYAYDEDNIPLQMIIIHKELEYFKEDKK